MLRKLGAVKHTKFVNYILPKKTSDLIFKETVTVLLEIFSLKTLFHKRWKCMNLIKKEDDNFTMFANIVNDQCAKFKLAGLSLIFVQGLASTEDTERVLINWKTNPI